jgi:hypothetical protein
LHSEKIKGPPRHQAGLFAVTNSVRRVDLFLEKAQGICAA